MFIDSKVLIRVSVSMGDFVCAGWLEVRIDLFDSVFNLIRTVQWALLRSVALGDDISN